MLQVLDATHFLYESYNLQYEKFLFLDLLGTLISIKRTQIMINLSKKGINLNF